MPASGSPWHQMMVSAEIASFKEQIWPCTPQSREASGPLSSLKRGWKQKPERGVYWKRIYDKLATPVSWSPIISQSLISESVRLLLVRPWPVGIIRNGVLFHR